MTTILLTGGAGFIGSNFVHFVLEARRDVRLINLDAGDMVMDVACVVNEEKIAETGLPTQPETAESLEVMQATHPAVEGEPDEPTDL